MASATFINCDRNKNGVIEREEFTVWFGTQSSIQQQDDANIQFEAADRNGDGVIDPNEFHAWYDDWLNVYVPKTKKQQPNKWLPLIVFTVISLVMFIFFVANFFSDAQPYGLIASHLYYTPKKRYQIWRYFTYALVHTGWRHLLPNIITQMVFGVLLGMNSLPRALVIYAAGIFASVMAESLVHPTHDLFGVSGGVYALLAGNFVMICVKWTEISLKQKLTLACFLLLDFGIFLYQRFFAYVPNVSLAAHVAGILAGLFVGANILHKEKEERNKEKRWKCILQKCALATYFILMIVAICIHIFCGHYFPSVAS